MRNGLRHTEPSHKRFRRIATSWGHHDGSRSRLTTEAATWGCSRSLSFRHAVSSRYCTCNLPRLPHISPVFFRCPHTTHLEHRRRIIDDYALSFVQVFATTCYTAHTKAKDQHRSCRNAIRPTMLLHAFIVTRGYTKVFIPTHSNYKKIENCNPPG